jgi:hypothetical protein
MLGCRAARSQAASVARVVIISSRTATEGVVEGAYNLARPFAFRSPADQDDDEMPDFRQRPREATRGPAEREGLTTQQSAEICMFVLNRNDRQAALDELLSGKNWLSGRGRPRCSRSVVPSYSRRNRPRR